MTDDIVARLRDTTSGYALRTVFDEAADEIERLRIVVQGWENSARNAERDIAELRAERDEARREVCGLLVACHTDPDDEKPDPNLKNVHAEIRGWDCFKEKP